MTRLRLLSGVPATVIALVVGAVLAERAEATYPGRNGRLVLAVGGPSGRGGPTNLATVNPSGSGLVRLGAGGDPIWRPNGRRIQFTLRGSGTATTNAAGTAVHRQVIADAPGHRPVTIYSTSPTGRRIAYSVRLPPGTTDGWGVYLARPDGTHPRRVLTTHGHDAYLDQLRWSPDGHTLLGIEQQSRLWLMPASGRGAHVLVEPPPQGRAFDPSWSPDGRSVFYALDAGPEPAGAAVMEISTQGFAPRLVVEGAYLPVLSPDSSLLAYETTDGKLTIATANGTDARIVLSGRVDALDWQPLP